MSFKAVDVRHWQALTREQVDSAAGMRLLIGWLLLHDARPDTLDHFGLDHSIEQLLVQEEIPAASDTVQLLRALLACGDDIRSSIAVVLKSAFSTPACREYLVVHESGGVVWFNKERFEQFLQWLLIVRLVDRSSEQPAPRTIAVRLGTACREEQRLTEQAGHAGYRGTLFLQLVAPPRKGKRSGRGPKVNEPAAKAVPVKRATRTKTTKT